MSIFPFVGGAVAGAVASEALEQGKGVLPHVLSAYEEFLEHLPADFECMHRDLHKLAGSDRKDHKDIIASLITTNDEFVVSYPVGFHHLLLYSPAASISLSVNMPGLGNAIAKTTGTIWVTADWPEGSKISIATTNLTAQAQLLLRYCNYTVGAAL